MVECREEIDASESQSVLIPPTSLPYLLVSPGSDEASDSEPLRSLLGGLRGPTGLGAFSPCGMRRNGIPPPAPGMVNGPRTKKARRPCCERVTACRE